MATTILREKTVVNQTAYEEQRGFIGSLPKENTELKEAKDDLQKTSNELQQKDEEVVTKTVSLCQAEKEVRKLKDKAMK